MDPNKSLVRRQRAPKTTADQYEVFLEFAIRNQSIVDNKRDPLDSEASVQQKWNELTGILNSSGRGPQRNPKEWQNTFSNWKNSIRHKMKCIMDGTSRTMLTELESRALQLWELNLNLNRYQRVKRDTIAPVGHELADLAKHGQHDESTHSSVSAFFLGAGIGAVGAGGSNFNGIAHIKEERPSNGRMQRMLVNGNGTGGSHHHHSGAANMSLVRMTRGGAPVEDAETDEATASAAGADDDEEPEENDEDEEEEEDDEEEVEAGEADNDVDDEEEFEEEDNSMPQRTVSATPLSMPPVKRRKYDTQPYQQRLAAVPAHQLQYGRNGTGGAAYVYNRSAGGGGSTDGLDGSILIAESISKLADNVGSIADSIREISAAFTTTTQSAFELIRRQSEIIQRLIEK